MKLKEKQLAENIKVVSFFAGCGGLDLGMQGGFTYKGSKADRLPFHIIGAFDNDIKCVDTYNLNFDANATQLDLANSEVDDLPPASVLVGGFPCQDFATCGPRKGLSSRRGQLYKVMVEYAKKHEPLVILGENVPGLANLHKGSVLNKIETDLARAGYRVKTWSLYGPDYGIPQNRTRLFIVCVRNDLYGFPKPPARRFLGKHRSINWAIGDLEGILDESVPNQSQYFRASKAKNGNGQGDETSHRDKPAYTVRANAKSRVQFHYNINRRLTVRECARLQTFPDTFVFPHSATTNIMQIGNAVPPLLAHKVAKSIADYLTGLPAEQRKNHERYRHHSNT